jgi:hypothetical protein
MLGCGGGSMKSVVKGKVTLNGAPLSSGTVKFVAQSSEGTTVSSIIDNGNYHIANFPPGEAKIAVEGPGPSSNPDEKTVPVHIPEKYLNPMTSGLSFTVKSGQQTFDINLTP